MKRTIRNAVNQAMNELIKGTCPNVLVVVEATGSEVFGERVSDSKMKLCVNLRGSDR